MSNEVISVKNLKKTFKISKRGKGLPAFIANLLFPRFEYKKAVDNISFEISQGEAVGFIGSNGAGKSTTIKMLSGIIYPDSGDVKVLGFVPYKERLEYVSNIGVVFGQKSQLAWDLPVMDSFELLQHIYSIPKDKYEQKLNEFCELLDMNSFINQPVRQLSLGQRMRADIAAALLHSPKIVFFDEPTIGLDVVAKEKIRNFIRYLNKEQGVTVIFTTHDMQDVEQICNRLIIIDKGKKIYDDSVKSLLSEYANIKQLNVEFKKYYNLDLNSDVEVKDCKDYKKEITFDTKKISVKSIINRLCENYDVADLSIENVSIESIVRQVYEGGIKL